MLNVSYYTDDTDEDDNDYETFLQSCNITLESELTSIFVDEDQSSSLGIPLTNVHALTNRQPSPNMTYIDETANNNIGESYQIQTVGPRELSELHSHHLQELEFANFPQYALTTNSEYSTLSEHSSNSSIFEAKRLPNNLEGPNKKCHPWSTSMNITKSL